MKVNLWNSVGDYLQNLEIEYNAEKSADCEQAEKYLKAMLSAYSETGAETEVTEDAGGQGAPVDG